MRCMILSPTTSLVCSTPSAKAASFSLPGKPNALPSDIVQRHWRRSGEGHSYLGLRMYFQIIRSKLAFHAWSVPPPSTTSMISSGTASPGSQTLGSGESEVQKDTHHRSVERSIAYRCTPEALSSTPLRVSKSRWSCMRGYAAMSSNSSSSVASKSSSART